MSEVNILQELYDSEINFSISTFWDGGFDAKLGDEINGFVAYSDFETLFEAIHYLKESAICYYPKSEFAKRYNFN